MKSTIFLAALIVAGCGRGATSVTPSSTPSPQTVTVMVGANGAMAFAPATVAINVGDTVHWVWQSGRHTVASGMSGVADGSFCSLPAGEQPSAARCAMTDY